MPAMLTNTSVLTGQVVLNPDVMQTDAPLVVFLHELVDHYRLMLKLDSEEPIPDEDKPDLGEQFAKLCVLGMPGKQGKQKMGGEQVISINHGMAICTPFFQLLFLCITKMNKLEWKTEYPQTTSTIADHM